MNNINKNRKNNNSLLGKGKYSAIEIARLLLSYDPERKYFKDRKMSLRADETNSTIGNFRLNKMLHICYMLYYSKYGKPLFWESLRAYPKGALVYKILMNFLYIKKYYYNNIFIDKIFKILEEYEIYKKLFYIIINNIII